ncbi:MAG TPA: sulfite exporter TauE/SafE family protein [Chthonomonadales bacterium]|nr:sulfite exporter TauE/SafE family protein [Chthonomonadales bacterium]
MTPIHFVEIFLIAVFAGVFGAMMGLGGGIILVPALLAILHVDRQVAVAASVVSVIATSSAAAIAYVRDCYADIRLALLLETATTPGAIVGAVLAQHLSDEFVAALFAFFLVYAAYALVRTKAYTPVDTTVASPHAITGSYYDLEGRKQVDYRVFRTHEGLIAGFFAGNLSAILGVGGGLIMVPAMATRMGVPLRVAVATSNLMIGVTAVTTAIPYYATGAVNPYYAAPCALGVLLGARAGAGLAKHTRSHYIRLAFAVVLLYTAYTMAIRAFW